MILLLIVVAGLFTPQTPQSPKMLLPEGNGAWMVEVTASGGLLALHDRDFALSSEGKITCGADLNCPKEFQTPPLQPLIEMIQSTLPVPPPAVISFCSDCIRRTITIRRRDSVGVLHTYTASWDETTRGQLPEEVIKVYEAVTALLK